MVVEQSVYDRFQIIYDTKDPDLLQKHIKIHYAHTFLSVRFYLKKNSFICRACNYLICGYEGEQHLFEIVWKRHGGKFQYHFNEHSIRWRCKFLQFDRVLFTIVNLRLWTCCIFKQNDATWVNSTLVGNGSRYNHRDLLDAELSLKEFTNYMTRNKRKIPFSFDIAASVFKLRRNKRMIILNNINF